MQKDGNNRWLQWLFILLMGLYTAKGLANSLAPRFSANAYTGVYTIGSADLMLSLDGDQIHNLYVNPQATYGTDQQWLVDLGLGYRWIINDAAILGWYTFAGRTRVNNNSDFWIANPGVEVLGRRYDAHLNAYIPVAGRSHEINYQYQLNSISEPFFTGHSEIINNAFDLANEIERIGNGADAMVAYQPFRQVPLKAYVGAYFFYIPGSTHLRGAIAGFQYWFDQNLKLFSNYSVDNYQHSKLIAGLGVSFGGVRKHTADPSLPERLTDPVERYLAHWGHGSGIPSRTLFFLEGQGTSVQLISNNIAFFSQNGSPNNGGMNLNLTHCTFENPCAPSDFSQTGVNTLNTLLPNTTMFFNGGNYPALNSAGTGAISLNPGQSVASRSTDYTESVTGVDRSVFNGAFILNSNNTLNDIILLPTSNTAAGNAINATNAENVNINGSQIGSAANPSLNTALFLSASQFSLNNSNVFASRRIIRAQANSSLTIQSSQLNVTRTVGGAITGISITGQSSGDMENSQLNVSGLGNAFAINVLSNSQFNITNSNISVASTGANSTVRGITTQTGGSVFMELGNLSVTSPSPNAEITSGSNISLFAVECLLNGTTVVC